MSLHEQKVEMKILITVTEKDVAPRFDLANEIVVAKSEDGKISGRPRTILLPRPSAEELCGLILKEGVSLVVCGGIEENHCSYLTWKKVKVIDSVIGPYQDALIAACNGDLLPGAIFFKRE